MLTAKVLSTVTLLGMVCPFLQPVLADAAGMEPLPVWGQFGISGMIAALHWWTIAKTIPSISRNHKSGLSEVAQQVSGLRSDLKKNMDGQIDLLREAMKRK